MKRIKVYVDRDTGTIYEQNAQTGLMEGRHRVKGMGDKTAVWRSQSTGQIYGRTSPPPYPKKGKTVEVEQHSRNNGSVQVRRHRRTA